VTTRPSSPAPEDLAHQPPPRPDGALLVTITYLDLPRAVWRRAPPADPGDVTISRESTPSVALYRELYDAVGRPWLWYERRLLTDAELAALLNAPAHELHVARDGQRTLAGYFELDFAAYDDGAVEVVFFGLTPAFLGRRLGAWFLDRTLERAFSRGAPAVRLNTNTLDHPRALTNYRRLGFQPIRREEKSLRDPRVLWPELYRWPPV